MSKITNVLYVRPLSVLRIGGMYFVTVIRLTSLGLMLCRLALKLGMCRNRSVKLIEKRLTILDKNFMFRNAFVQNMY